MATATGRIPVERALLVSTIASLNEAEVKQYEKDLAVYEKAKIAQNKRIEALALKIAKIIAKSEVKDLDLRDDYDWSNGYNSERIEYVRVQLELKGLTASDLGGTYRSNSLSKPSDPRTQDSGKYHEREQMLRTLALTTKDEIMLPIKWSEQYL
jgi:hypothetical protein